MANHYKTMQLIPAQLGLTEEEIIKVIRIQNKRQMERAEHVSEAKKANTNSKANSSKAAELERLLELKWTARSRITDTSKVIICLDLAAAMFGIDLDQEKVIKYSGLKPAMYTKNRKVVESLVGLNSDILTTSMLCVIFQCSRVQDLADNILEKYRRLAKMEVDLHQPHYVCMAVYHACRINKIKVSTNKIMEKSRLKPSQWPKVNAEWNKFVEEHFPVAMKKRGRPPKVLTGAETTEPMEIDQPKDLAPPPEPQIEPFEVWKRRILEDAYKERKLLEEEAKCNPKE